MRRGKAAPLFCRQDLKRGIEWKKDMHSLWMKVNHGFDGSPDGLTGYNPITRGRESIALALGLEEYAARFFGNGARPSAVLQHPQTLSEPAKKSLRKAWEEIHKGLGNAHRIAVLEEGMQLKEFSIDPEKAQALQSRQFSVIEVARLFGVPPHLLMDLERATYSNIEEQTLEFVKYCIRPWIERIEQEYDTQLLLEKDRKKYEFKHKIEGLLRGDSKSRAEFYKTLHMVGALSPNDVRELEDWNPVENGDEYFVQMNMVPLSRALEPPEPIPAFGNEPQQKNVQKLTEIRTKRAIEGRNKLVHSFGRLFLDAGQSIVRREVIAVKKAVKKHLGQRNQQGFEEWLNGFYADLTPHIRRVMLPVLLTYKDAIENQVRNEIGNIVITPELDEFIENYLSNYSNRHIKTSVQQLQALLRDTLPEEIENVLLTRLDEWDETRASKIQDRESKQFLNGWASIAILASGFMLVWRNQGKSCPYCEMLEGIVIRQGQYFAHKGDLKPEDEPPFYVRNNRKHPPLHNGCDCYAMPS